MDLPLVVKIGGSLTDHAAAVVGEVLDAGVPALVVPGGGQFADAVRALAPPDTPAHWMAVAAMEAYGWYLSSFGVPVTADLAAPESPTVFLPYAALRAHDPLPHSWAVTSDTIAAWAAREIGASLVLVKSVDCLTRGGVPVAAVHEPFPCEEVDSLLLPYLFDHHIPARIVNGRVEGRLRALLKGEDVPCTSVYTSI
jgi:aspartokinase-like uncharacterized kinase